MLYTVNPEVLKQYKKWWKGLKHNERKRLIMCGAFDGLNISNADATLTRDIANDTPLNFAVSDHEWIPQLIKTGKDDIINQVISAEEGSDVDKNHHKVLATIRWRSTVHFILDAMDSSTDADTRLSADVIRLVIGEGSPPNMTTLATKYNLSRAAISHRCRQLLRKFGLDPSIFMLPETMVNKYRVSSILKNNSNVVGIPKQATSTPKAVRKGTAKRLK